VAQPAPLLPDDRVTDDEPPLVVVTAVIAARTLGEIERVFGI